MKEELELKLQAWVDGELPPAEDATLRRLVAQDAEAAALVAELRLVKSVLAQPEPKLVFPETREFYWHKIQRQIRREALAHRSPAPSWAGRMLRWLAPVAGVAAVGAALILALSQSAPQILNQVSETSGEMQAHTFRDRSAGINFVVFQDAPLPVVHTRNDGSSFMIETE